MVQILLLLYDSRLRGNDGREHKKSPIEFSIGDFLCMVLYTTLTVLVALQLAHLSLYLLLLKANGQYHHKCLIALKQL